MLQTHESQETEQETEARKIHHCPTRNKKFITEGDRNKHRSQAPTCKIIWEQENKQETTAATRHAHEHSKHRGNYETMNTNMRIATHMRNYITWTRKEE